MERKSPLEILKNIVEIIALVIGGVWVCLTYFADIKRDQIKESEVGLKEADMEFDIDLKRESHNDTLWALQMTLKIESPHKSKRVMLHPCAYQFYGLKMKVRKNKRCDSDTKRMLKTYDDSEFLIGYDFDTVSLGYGNIWPGSLFRPGIERQRQIVLYVPKKKFDKALVTVQMRTFNDKDGYPANYSVKWVKRNDAFHPLFIDPIDENGQEPEVTKRYEFAQINLPNKGVD